MSIWFYIANKRLFDPSFFHFSYTPIIPDYANPGQKKKIFFKYKNIYKIETNPH